MMMEYRRAPITTGTVLASSASLVHRNLCVVKGLLAKNSISYAVAHKATANVVHVIDDTAAQQEVNYEPTKDKDSNAHITQVKLCRVKNQRTVIVLTSYKGFKILDWASAVELYVNKFETPPGSFVRRFARGVASVGDYVCVGTSDGSVLMLKIPAQGSHISVMKELKGHSSPIADLATDSRGHLASSDETGTITVWEDPLAMDESSVVIADASEVPCMCLCLWDKLVIGGFTNGQIVVYNSESGAKMVEIAAHARSITAMDVAPKTGLLLSVSEDCTASVWRLQAVTDVKVTHLFSATVANTLLCGGQFCNAEGTEFAMIGFESVQVVTYTSGKPPSRLRSGKQLHGAT